MSAEVKDWDGVKVVLPPWGGQAPEGRIEALERKISCRLPDDYRTYLERFHGGTFGDASSVFLPDLDEFCAFGRVATFRENDELSRSLDHSSFDWYMDEMSGVFDEGTLVIGDDCSGGAWGLVLAEEGFGSVVYASPEAVRGDEPARLIARSFREFVQMLELVEE